MKKLILTILCGILFFGTVPSYGETNVIKEGSTVTFDYTLTVEGNVIDSSEGKEPLEYTHGQEMIIPGLESELEGLKATDTKKVIIAAKDAYGLRNEELIMEVPKSNLGPDITPEVGMVLQMQGPEDQPMPAVIAEIKEETILLDLNHPLADKELNFDVTIVSVNN